MIDSERLAPHQHSVVATDSHVDDAVYGGVVIVRGARLRADSESSSSQRHRAEKKDCVMKTTLPSASI